MSLSHFLGTAAAGASNRYQPSTHIFILAFLWSFKGTRYLKPHKRFPASLGSKCVGETDDAATQKVLHFQWLFL